VRALREDMFLVSKVALEFEGFFFGANKCSVCGMSIAQENWLQAHMHTRFERGLAHSAVCE
jgi:hypothetical protein